MRQGQFTQRTKCSHKGKPDIYLEQQYQQLCPNFRTITFGKRSLRYEGASLQNCLHSRVKVSANLKEFKRHILLWEGQQCNCNSCTLCELMSCRMEGSSQNVLIHSCMLNISLNFFKSSFVNRSYFSFPFINVESVNTTLCSCYCFCDADVK